MLSTIDTTKTTNFIWNIYLKNSYYKLE